MPELDRPSRRALWGIFVRKERWGLSWLGLLCISLFCTLTCLAFIGLAYPFFAVTSRVETKILVVEGWVHESAIKVAAVEFQTGSYQRVFTTGGPVQGTGGYTNDYNTSASVGAGRLRKAGVPTELVQMVPSRVADKDRTYHAALALNAWLLQHDPSVTAINIVTEDVHARRTRLLFQEALGDRVKVGIIAVPNADYDATHWWRYSEGVRETLGETIAYLYARFIFIPFN